MSHEIDTVRRTELTKSLFFNLYEIDNSVKISLSHQPGYKNCSNYAIAIQVAVNNLLKS